MKLLAVQRDGTEIDTSQLAFKIHIDLGEIIILYFKEANGDLNLGENSLV